MNATAKLASFVLLFILITAASGQLLVVHSETSPFQNKALAYIQNVLPLNLTLYTLTFSGEYALPLIPGNPVETEAANYMLSSSAGQLLVHFTFRNGLLHECALTNPSRSLIYARSYANMADVATEILQRYQNHTGIDSTELISLLRQVDETTYSSASSEHVNLTVSHFSIPTHIDLSSGHIQPIGNDTINDTSFNWVFSYNGAGYMCATMRFENGVFSRFTDDRAVYTIGSTEVTVTKEQASNIAKDHIGSHTFILSNGTRLFFNMSAAQVTTHLASSQRNGTVLYPCWSVLLDFDNSPRNDVSINLWADTGEIFWCYLGGTPLKVDDSSPQVTAAPQSELVVTPTATPTTTPTASPSAFQTTSPEPLPASNAKTSAPQLAPTEEPTENKAIYTVNPTPAPSQLNAVMENPAEKIEQSSNSLLIAGIAVFAVALGIIAEVMLMRRRR